MKFAMRSRANSRYVSADDLLTANNPVPPHTPPQVTVGVPNRVLQPNKDAIGLWEQYDLMVEIPEGSGNWVPFEMPAPTPVPPPQPDGSNLWKLCGQTPGVDLVTCVHDAVKPASTPEGAFEVTKRVAWLLRGLGYGLLRKDGGENIVTWNGVSCSAGRICTVDGSLVKILTDVPTTNGPAWSDNGTVDPSFYVPAMDPDV